MSKFLYTVQTNEIESVKRVDNLEKIGWGAFDGCTSLKSFTANKVEKIGNYTFFECKNLITVNMLSVKNIGKIAFIGCNKLESIKIDTKVFKKYRSAFPENIVNKAFDDNDNELFENIKNKRTQKKETLNRELNKIIENEENILQSRKNIKDALKNNSCSLADLLYKGGVPKTFDIMQSDIGDCYLLSALIELAK